MSKARDIASAAPAPSTVSATEIGYLDGVTSAIQTQIDSKIGSASAISPTLIDAKGDLIVGSAADTAARLAVGTNNYVLTADSSTTTGLKWAAAAGGGKVLQVVYGSTTTPVSSSSATYADTTLSATITPSSATSKVLVFVNQQGVNKTTGNTGSAVALRLLRGSTVILSPFAAYAAYTNSDVRNTISVSTSYLDSPSTTSATTYKTQFANPAAAASAYVQYLDDVSTIILMEIGA